MQPSAWRGHKAALAAALAVEVAIFAIFAPNFFTLANFFEIARLNAELTKMMQAGEMRDRLAAMGIQPLTSTPERFGEFFRAEVTKWAAVVKESGARAD